MKPESLENLIQDIAANHGLSKPPAKPGKLARHKLDDEDSLDETGAEEADQLVPDDGGTPGSTQSLLLAQAETGAVADAGGVKAETDQNASGADQSRDAIGAGGVGDDASFGGLGAWLLGGLALGGLALAGGGGGGRGSGSSGDKAETDQIAAGANHSPGAIGVGVAGGSGVDDIDGGNPAPAAGSVSFTVVGGPVIDGHGLTVEIFQADGVSKLGTAKLDANGKVRVSVGSYTGVVIAHVLDADVGNDYLDEATHAGKDLNAELYGVGVITSAGSTLTLNINPLTTVAYHKAVEAVGSGQPLSASAVNSANGAIAKAFGLQDLHATTVITTNGDTGYNATDGLSAGETYGAVLAALSGGDANNGGNAQTTIDHLVAGIRISDGKAILNAHVQEEIVAGGKTAGVNDHADISKLVDTTPPVFTTPLTADALNAGTGAGQSVYLASASDASPVHYSLAHTADWQHFSLAPNGVVTLLDNPDYNVKASYQFTVIAMDEANNTNQQPVALAINPTAGSVFTNSGYYQTFYDLAQASYYHIPGFAPYPYSLNFGMLGDFNQNAIDGFARLEANGIKLLDASDLSIHEPSANFDAQFKLGYYAAYDQRFSYNYFPAASSSVAMVGRTSDALFLTFRGTDVWQDWVDDVAFMSKHYENYRPLFDAIDTYLNDRTEIKTVYVGGHSLGGQMAAWYMKDNNDFSAKHPLVSYQAVTFEAANKLMALTEWQSLHDERYLNFEVRGDFVPDIGLGRNYGNSIYIDTETQFLLGDMGAVATTHPLAFAKNYLAQVTSLLDDNPIGSDVRIYIDTDNNGVMETNASSPWQSLLLFAMSLEDTGEYAPNPYRIEFETSWGTTPDHTLVVTPPSSGGYVVPAVGIDNIIVSNTTLPRYYLDIYGQNVAHDLLIVGSDIKNILVGGGGADVVVGNGDQDVLMGGGGGDILYGGNWGSLGSYMAVENYLPLTQAGRDELSTHQGGDLVDDPSYLIGGSGPDIIVGSGATDYMFVDIEPSLGVNYLDHIYNFNPGGLVGQDYIVLSYQQLGIIDPSAIASKYDEALGKVAWQLRENAWAQNFDRFNRTPNLGAGTAFYLRSDLSYDSSATYSAYLMFDPDGNGRQAPITLAQLQGPFDRGYTIYNLDGNLGRNILLVDNFSGMSFDGRSLDLATLGDNKPTVSIQGLLADSIDDPFTVTFAFSEPVDSFTSNDVHVSNGTAGGFTVVSGSEYTTEITPSDGATGNVRIEIAENVATGLNSRLGNSAAVAVQAFDTLAPSVVISDDTPGTANGEITYTITFSEPVFNFTADDITVGNGSKGAFAPVPDSALDGSPAYSVYTLVVTPNPHATGNVTLDIAADTANDRVGNGNTAATQSLQAFNTTSTVSYTPGQDVIDLGEYGKLIAPVFVDGNWYYAWDINGDGVHDYSAPTDTGIPYDIIMHDVLDVIFTEDANGNPNPGSDTTDTYRYATLSGVRVALMRVGPYSGESSYGATSTEIDNIPAGEINPIYDDLLAVWDSENGSSVSTAVYGVPATFIYGTPTGWLAYEYNSATPSVWGHASVSLDTGLVSVGNEVNYLPVGLQVFPSRNSAMTPPNFTSATTATVEENTPVSTVVYDATADNDVGMYYTIGGTDGVLFNIDHDIGAVTFKTSPDYENGLGSGDNDNLYDFTVTATDLANNSATLDVQLTVTDVAEASYTPGQAVIDLNEYGKLIAPAHVDGKWYYYWNISGNGNVSVDYCDHDFLDNLFRYASDFSSLNPGEDTDNNYRYGILNGVKLALPTIGGWGENHAGNIFAPGTSVENNPAGEINPTYDDLLAIWDAYNGAAQELSGWGFPPGWDYGPRYWTATSAGAGYHFDVNLSRGSIGAWGDEPWGTADHRVALEVLG